MKRLYWIGIFALFVTVLRAQLSETPYPGFWVTDGPVYAIAEMNGLVYAGGQFGYVGPNTGSGALLDAQSGQANSQFPTFNGPVTAAVADGAGGWFVAGNFTSVGGLPRTNLVHIAADETVTSVIYPSVSGPIHTLTILGSDIVVAGSFSIATTNGPLSNLVAIDAGNGALKQWNSGVEGSVTAVATYNNQIYFATGNGIGVTSEAKDGMRFLPPRFGDTTGDGVAAVALSGHVLYVGGNFREIDFTPHGCAAAIDLDTESILPWNPLPDSFSPFVSAIVADGSSVYVGVGGLSAFDATTAALKWQTAISNGGGIEALALQGDTLYVGGSFVRMDSARRLRLAAVNAQNGVVLSWSPQANGNAHALSVSGARIFAGGNFTSVGGQLRSNLAAFDPSSGAATAWAPATDGAVTTMEACTNAIFIGGQFTSVNSTDRYCLAALDPATGTNLAFDAQVGKSQYPSRVPVYSLARSGDTIFVGGSFTGIFGTTQKCLAAFSATTFQMNTNWAPQLTSSFLDGGVTKIVCSSNLVYLAGFFTKVNGVARTNLAALDLQTATLTSWDPKVAGFASGEPLVGGMSMLGSRMFLWGSFSSVGGAAHTRAAAIDLKSAAPLDWNIGATLTNRCFLIQPIGDTVFVTLVEGGGGGTLRTYDPISGAPTGWTARYPWPVTQIINADHALFTATAGGLAVFVAAPSFEKPPERATGTFAVGAFPGQSFRIDVSTDLITWTELMTGDASTDSFSDPNFGAGSQRFYRIVPLNH